MIINRKELAKAKIAKLKQGYSAFAETKELAQMIEKKIKELQLDVDIDRTPFGCWFIPKKEDSKDE